jgi:hypothetical protein
MHEYGISNIPLFWKSEFNADLTSSFTGNFRYSHTHKKWLPFYQLSTSEFVDSSFIIKGYFENGSYVSPHKSTFGGFLKLDENPNEEAIFLEFVQMLRTKFKITVIKLTLPSDHIAGAQTISCNKIFLNLKQDKMETQLVSEINHSIQLNNWTIAKMSKGNRKKLRQCLENNVNTREISLKELPEAYEIMNQNRKGLGADLSITLDKLIESKKQFPDFYHVFGTFLTDKMIAAAVTVESFPTNLYVYMWADKNEYRSLSPLVSTAVSLTGFAKAKMYEFLDLGTSSINGEVLVGVRRFKLNLGAVECQKPTITMTYS